MIEIKNLYLKYIREYYALYNISLNIKEGECVCLVGQQASGKTTLLRVLAKLEKFEKGEVYIKDHALKKIDFKDDIHLGYVSYRPVFLEKKTVYENFKFVLDARKLPKDEIEQRINDAFINFNLEKYRNTKIKDLSVFEKYVISLVRLSLRQLDVALIDNIFTNLSEEEQEKIEYLIKNILLDKQVTTLIATESEDIAHKFSNRIVHFENGSIKGEENA
ncbi:MAG: ATP-binding cassette domain-containing protein [Clostridia bacterium]|nr:ATP-binding cassette domain-containing protein [Clostridia bacterium]